MVPCWGANTQSVLQHTSPPPQQVTDPLGQQWSPQEILLHTQFALLSHCWSMPQEVPGGSGLQEPLAGSHSWHVSHFFAKGQMLPTHDAGSSWQGSGGVTQLSTHAPLLGSQVWQARSQSLGEHVPLAGSHTSHL